MLGAFSIFFCQALKRPLPPYLFILILAPVKALIL